MISVYHNSNFLAAHRIGLKEAIKQGILIKVADVDTEDLDKAYELTNNIDHSWWENTEVTKCVPGSIRSTSVGDVLIHNEIKYAVDIMGFTRI